MTYILKGLEILGGAKMPPPKEINFFFFSLLLEHQIEFTDYWSVNLFAPSHCNLTKKWNAGVPPHPPLPGIGLTKDAQYLILSLLYSCCMRSRLRGPCSGFHPNNQSTLWSNLQAEDKEYFDILLLAYFVMEKFLDKTSSYQWSSLYLRASSFWVWLHIWGLF